LDPLSLEKSLEGENWAEKAFGNAPLVDKRLVRRLVEICLDKANNPGYSYSGATQGDWTKVKANYQFIDQPETPP
jgi:hypothetical protein